MDVFVLMLRTNTLDEFKPNEPVRIMGVFRTLEAAKTCAWASGRRFAEKGSYVLDWRKHWERIDSSTWQQTTMWKPVTPFTEDGKRRYRFEESLVIQKERISG